VESVAEKIAPVDMFGEWTDDDPTDVEVTYKGKTSRLGLTLAPIDRSLALAGLNRIMAGDFEIRAFKVTVGTSDTLSCYVKPSSWWKSMDAEFPSEMAKTFMVLPEGVDLFSLPPPT
jgi:hypothetical protein